MAKPPKQFPRTPLIQLHKGAHDQLEMEESMRMQLHMDEMSRNLAHRNNTFRDVLGAAIRHHGLPTWENAPEFLKNIRLVSDKIAIDELKAKWEATKDLFDHLEPKVVGAHLIWSASTVGVDLVDRLDASAAAPAEDIRPPSVILPG